MHSVSNLTKKIDFTFRLKLKDKEAKSICRKLLLQTFILMINSLIHYRNIGSDTYPHNANKY